MQKDYQSCDTIAWHLQLKTTLDILQLYDMAIQAWFANHYHLTSFRITASEASSSSWKYVFQIIFPQIYYPAVFRDES